MPTYPRPDWLTDYTLWAVKGRTGPRPASVPRRIPTRYLWIPAWVKWNLAGRNLRKRPDDAPADLGRWPWIWTLHQEIVAALVQPPPPASVDPLDVGRNLAIMAGNPLDALLSPPSVGVVLSCDRNFVDEWCSPEVVRALRDAGRRVYSWCDCRPHSVGTPPSYAIGRFEALHLDGWLGQAESAAEADYALKGVPFGLPPVALVGNLSALRPDQLARVASGDVIFINETYHNVPGNVPATGPDWRNANKGVAGNAVACYASAGENATRIPLADQIARGWFVPGRDSVYAPGMLPDDWKAWREAK